METKEKHGARSGFMKNFWFALIAAALVTGALGSCDFLIGPDEPVGSAGGNLVISVGKGGGRAITSGGQLPDKVLEAMRYELTLTGPGGETLNRTVVNGENIKLTVALGVWRIDARAYNEDGLAGTKSIEIKVVPGVNSVDLSMEINGGYFNIAVDSSLNNGKVESSFDAAFPETTITLTVTPDERYVLKNGTLMYSYGGKDYTPEGSGPAYTFAMPASDITVGAEFMTSYGITILPEIVNGTVTAGFDAAFPDIDEIPTAFPGTVITLTVTPDDGFVLKSGSLKYSYGGKDYTPEGSGPAYTFVMPASDVTVSAFFNKVIDTITIEGPQDELIPVTWEKNPGNTLPDKKISWSNGDTITFTVAGYTSGVDLMWFMEGKLYNGTGDSLTIYAKDFALRSYSVTVMVKVDDLLYSATDSLEIVR
jgi:hypothetical protein